MSRHIASLSLKPPWTPHPIQFSLPLTLTEARDSVASGSLFSEAAGGPRVKLIKFISLYQIQQSHYLSTLTHSEGGRPACHSAFRMNCA